MRKTIQGHFDTFKPVEVILKGVERWLSHTHSSPNPIRMGEPNTTLTTDASLEGWGAPVHTHMAGGRWIEGEADEHINIIVLKAILFGLKSLLRIPRLMSESSQITPQQWLTYGIWAVLDSKLVTLSPN